MSLEEFTLDEGISESGSSGAEKVSEISEKFKESVKKASTGIARTRKDEKKAKKQDMLLAGFLVKILLNKKYDVLLKKLFELIDLGVASNFILGVMSLVYIDISNEIRKNSGKKIINLKYNFNKKEKIEFDDSNIDESIRKRINFWIEDIYDAILSEYSVVLTKRLIKLLENEEKNIEFIALVFKFFLKELNINISKKKAISIGEFIILELLNNLKKLELPKI